MSRSKPSSKVTTAGNRYSTKFWVTNDKRTIPVAGMATSHILKALEAIKHRNKLRMEKGLRPWRLEFIPRLRAELAFREWLDGNRKDT